ncbi:acyl-CoA/acyl-ACP dehydrogenase [Streptomyces sp. NBC_00249]|uniref:acyl-CoA dehydrogenase family protein n=1 Tax=Streptomyces sp. NBC_00249 TaxID=2975690 RepID=UPI0022502D68|nr:acyl-CoA dehydrogenase family protein [Streptomyces sp. NBC_00249]MCX5197634.1 acyl-CoA/acyl-ACP dehydrogenase [Streptomyces sp. NBC_00249]
MQRAPGAGTALATPPALAADPLVAAVTETAVRVLRPETERTAGSGVPRTHLDALAACGAYGLIGYEPGAASGLTARQVTREVHEVLAAVDPSTWFVWTQHVPLAKALLKASGPAGAALREEWLPALASGERRATAGFAFLRHPRPPVTARRVAGGWRLDGRVPWVTGWGLADTLFVGAVTEADEVVLALADCAPDRGLTAVAGAPLWAMGGTHTAAVELRDVHVPDARVLGREPRADWIRAYDEENADAQPAVFGQLRATADHLLHESAYEELGLRLARRTAALRAEAYALRDEAPPGGFAEARLALRAASLDLAVRSAAVCVAVAGGRAIQYGHAAGRLSREAQFHLIQAQTTPLRTETARLMLGDV